VGYTLQLSQTKPMANDLGLIAVVQGHHTIDDEPIRHTYDLHPAAASAWMTDHLGAPGARSLEACLIDSSFELNEHG